MLSMLLRPFVGSRRNSQQKADAADEEQDPEPPAGPSIREYSQHRHATADFTEADDDDEDESIDQGRGTYNDGNRPEVDEDGLPQSASVLPLFSATHLDSLPVYSITHAIRIIVQARTETTLTWEQLRSPQVSQFLVKPMLQQIRALHFSRATLYALMANCLQFEKEGQLYPGNAGTSSTRAKVCELLAIKMLKEYTTRELIDALAYDFYPLQGIPGTHTPLAPGGKGKPPALRTSTLEVAIRASAKHFLAHPLVVQQLEAIWNGAISFYSTADQLHRQNSVSTAAGPSHSRRQSTVRTPLLGSQSQQVKEEQARLQSPPGRRSVALYDPRNASLFKLSRLRVPRYRQFLSTCSLAILICLFLAVLIQRSSRITSLELVFWFWSAGFMLDELVGFSEQGFSLYIMSFWNIFDLGILMLLIVYYCMRIYGVFLLDPHKWNQNAYDVLAANAILLLPRIFSVLDHYQYFSQLLIAFRLMAIDLAAVLVLVLISCSGFFVFFTLSKNENSADVVAYKIFQILMGFTPAAWEVWPSYNWLGRALMGLFLVICHFVVVTILITVLTNSFMSIASNAKQEHQFLFAINTISMVKNDSLFSYVAPGNIFAWALLPLRYFMPMKQYVWLNRSVIKATHFPLLFCIYVYERFLLAPSIYEPTDLVENPGRGRIRTISFADPASRTAFFSPNIRVREESLVGYQKDRALEEVFRRTPDMAALRTQRRNERRKTQNAIRSWMDQNDGGFHSPQNYSTIDTRLADEWQRRLSISREPQRRFPRHVSDVRSTASDPADLISNAAHPLGFNFHNDGISRRDYAVEVKNNTDNDADGDDELVTNDEDEEDNATNTVDGGRRYSAEVIDEDYFTTPVAARFSNAELESGASSYAQQKTPMSPRAGQSRRAALHSRTLSTNTILYAPQEMRRPHSSSSASIELPSRPRSRPLSTRHTPVHTPTAGHGDHRSPRRTLYMTSRPRPILPPRDMARTAPNRAALTLDIPHRKGPARRRSSVDLDASSDLNAVMAAADDTFGALPSSFATQMAMATAMLEKSSQGDNNRMSRLMLAKMKTLEESLGDVVREMRGLRSGGPSTAHNSGDEGSGSGKTRRQPPIRKGSDPASTSAGSLGPPMIEVAGRERGGGARRARTTVAAATTASSVRTPTMRTPLRRRSTKENKASLGGGGFDSEPLHASAIAKGKAKAVQRPPPAAWYSDETAESLLDEGDLEDSFTKRGSSF
ncbi:hypothetical protein QBC46DRAFT_253252 [Diplogelasinospora grovesii]|uniref:Ion transport domain-containing protein n=1 Tax=Diplogelasinospora grovesii TaxID=303347 RepID=A0AAN6NE81_9PEZI|nr:hypothetical protein QBC46DRAFT_253252 [Diplogelasinospora grovesii]